MTCLVRGCVTLSGEPVSPAGSGARLLAQRHLWKAAQRKHLVWLRQRRKLFAGAQGPERIGSYLCTFISLLVPKVHIGEEPVYLPAARR